MNEPESRFRPLVLRLGRFLFRIRDLAFLLLIVPMALLLRPAFAGRDVWIESALDALGIVVVAAGLALRSVALGLTYMKRGGKGKTLYADRLMTEGIYAHTRNPLYLGNILIVTGFAIIHGSIWLFAVAVPLVLLAYRLVVEAEEDFLAAAFGAPYDAYRRRVNRLLPTLGGLAGTLRRARLDWKRILRKEYGTIFACLSGVIFQLWWEEARWRGWNAERHHFRVSMLAWIPLLLLYGAVRVLKKRKLLENAGAAGRA